MIFMIELVKPLYYCSENDKEDAAGARTLYRSNEQAGV